MCDIFTNRTAYIIYEEYWNLLDVIWTVLICSVRLKNSETRCLSYLTIHLKIALSN